MNSLQSEQAAFAAAFSCATPGERAACLDAHCGSDAALRSRVEALLEAANRAGDFLEVPPAGTGVVMLCDQSGERIGRYKLLEKIGEGGCGVVYMAEQEEPVRRRVALKVIKPGMDTQAVIARFEAERQALALMDHTSIARVFDGGATPAGRPYFVMELVRGMPLTAFCDEALLPTAARLRLFVQVCQAVQHAHQKGIIHRDLKPSNILVTVNDGVPVPKIIDFGIAKATGLRLTDKSLFTQFHAFIGTPAYTSPEQAEMSSVDIDTRSDIYSLGVLLYELLTSRTPFDGDELLRSGLDEMRRVIRTTEPPRPSYRLGHLDKIEATALSARRRASVPELSSAVRGDLDWIVMKCLEKDRTRRYETASGLAADVQCHLNNEPIAARPPGQFYRFGKMVKKHKGVFAALTAFVFVLCAGIVVSVSQALRARRGEARATAALEELRASTPAFLAQARDLASRGLLAEAMEKLDHALRLMPEDNACLLTKADLLACQLKFSEAAGVYRLVCEHNPGDVSAQTRLSLCGQLALQPDRRTPQWRDTLGRLYALMLGELTHSDAEMRGMATLIFEDARLQLKDTVFAPHLQIDHGGWLSLDLRGVAFTDLSPLRGLPLQSLDVAGAAVTDLRPMVGSLLRSLNVSATKVVDLAPLAEMQHLRNLSIANSSVTDLTPLRGMALEWLDLTGTAVADITPLQGMMLRVLRCGSTRVADLTPLAGMPLSELECCSIPAQDFTPLKECPDLSYLIIFNTALSSLEIFRERNLRNIDFSGTMVTDLAPLAGMPLYTVQFYKTKISDIRPLLQCPALNKIGLPRSVSNTSALRMLTNVCRLSHRRGPDGDPAQTAADYWKENPASP